MSIFKLPPASARTLVASAERFDPLGNGPAPPPVPLAGGGGGVLDVPEVVPVVDPVFTIVLLGVVVGLGGAATTAGAAMKFSYSR